MKLAPKELPVTSFWLNHNGLRLDGSPYLTGAVQAKAVVDRLPHREPLRSVTKAIFNGPRFARVYVDDPEYGVPFLGSTDILAADFNNLPLISKKLVAHNPELIVKEGWTLITCSGTIGRMAYCRRDMAGMAGSQHFMRVVPDPEKIRSGYLYAFLASKYGVPQVTSGTYGGIIQHIEPSHIQGLTLARLGEETEEEIDALVCEASALRTHYIQEVHRATDLLFSSVGLSEIRAVDWHRKGRDLGFSVMSGDTNSLRALSWNPRMQTIFADLRTVQHTTVGDICSGGIMQRGARFVRMEADEGMGVKLVGQKELFWLEPEGREIVSTGLPDEVFVPDETICVASQGTLGEGEVYCRCELITGSWLNWAFSEHMLRIRPGAESPISGPYLFAFLRSETAFRCLRSMSMGSKQQDIDRVLLAKMPVPLTTPEIHDEITAIVRRAFEARHRASELEHQAVARVESEVFRRAA